MKIPWADEQLCAHAYPYLEDNDILDDTLIIVTNEQGLKQS